MNEKIKHIAHVDKKFLDYEFIEARQLTLTDSNGGSLQVNQRCYFGANNKLRGKRIVGIDILANTGNFFYNDVQFLSDAFLSQFTLTLLNHDSEEVVKDLPCSDLHPNQTQGRIRIFNVIPQIDKCYVINTVINLGAIFGLWFNFYTTND